MDCFSVDYPTAREKFRRAAKKGACWVSQWSIPGNRPQGESLTVDVAWLGERSAQRVLLHTSGLHGVEGFAGSAIQLQLLTESPERPPGTALVLLHILNPYGMRWLRRTNAENVDLNRNFVFPGQLRHGTSAAYQSLDPVLNPGYPPQVDLFCLRAFYALLRYGYRPLKAAIACGQYAFPRGLFYGGSALQPEVLAYHEWLRQHLPQPERLLVVDVHTGLGRSGQESLFNGLVATPTDDLSRLLARPLLLDGNQEKVLGYETFGAHQELYRQLFSTCATDFITQEFGTKPVWEVLQALRKENQWQHYGSGTLEHPCKRTLKEAFCLPSPAWQERIVAAGVRLVGRGLHFLASAE